MLPYNEGSLETRAQVVEALGPERAAFFDRLIEENGVDSGLIWNALFIQTFGLRLVAELLEPLQRANQLASPARDDGKLTLTLSALAQQMSIQEASRVQTAASLDALSKSLRETREVIFAATASQRNRTSTSFTKRSFATGIAAIGVLAVLACCISWSVAYRRGESVASYNDAAYAHHDGIGWNRFVRHELGLKK